MGPVRGLITLLALVERSEASQRVTELQIFGVFLRYCILLLTLHVSYEFVDTGGKLRHLILRLDVHVL